MAEKMKMLDQIKSFFGIEDAATNAQPAVLDKKLCAAALMVHVIAADGKVTVEEEAKMRSVLAEHYEMSPQEADELAQTASQAQGDAIDLYGFTSILKRDMNEEERLALIEDLWEMVYADGELHEFEDNVVWRVAELIGIGSRERMVLKQRVLSRQE